MRTLQDLTKVEYSLQTTLKQLDKEKRKERGVAKKKLDLESEISRVQWQITNLKAFSQLYDGAIVRHTVRTDKKTGVVFELMRTPGGMGQAWVSWDGGVAVPEQPELLAIETDNDVLSTLFTTANAD